ncbi:hypothetical protein G7Y89_g8004 [Cudoniella acicularis]|uniref:Uncharacterized protein n=1 Tax=Cudoniella acicularis TaxID=354080 RepID=A0A8H4RL07_9HELO|nr:hypothetical protein G7Y89_g8004 [Cudoniella acicularis]
MFRPSQATFLSATLGLSKLHRQLPLNPRESRKLLELLTTSFRQHLDAEHGPILSKSERTQLPNVKPKDKPIPHSSTRHIQSIVTNPLFLPPVISSGRHLNDSMVVFEQAVAKGMMNVKLATACLHHKRNDIREQYPSSLRAAMAESGAGRKVVNWLSSSGAGRDLEFFRDRSFTNLLMQFMVAEGLQDVAWAWINKNFQRHLPALPAFLGDKIYKSEYFSQQVCGPLVSLIKSEAKNGDTLDLAYLCLRRAADSLSEFPDTLRRMVLRRPVGTLVDVTIEAHSDHSAPTGANFDDFLSIMKDNNRGSAILCARLHLRHPTQPTVEPALQVLLNNPLKGQPIDSAKKIWFENRIINLGLDATKYLLEHERFSEADKVMEFLRSNFSKQLGEVEKKTLDDVSAEATSLEMLGDIGFTVA